MPTAVSNYVVDSYVRLRKLSKDEEHAKTAHTYTSARTLLGILRLAQALARLRFNDAVEHADVDEALRLMEASKESLQDEEEREQNREGDSSNMSKIFRAIKNMFETDRESPQPKLRRPRRLGKGPGGERDMDVDSDEDEGTQEISITEIRARLTARSFRDDDIMATIDKVGSALLLRKFKDADRWLSVRGIGRLDANRQGYKTAVRY